MMANRYIAGVRCTYCSEVVVLSIRAMEDFDEACLNDLGRHDHLH